MAKYITKGVSFNPESKRHMEVLTWAEGQSKNFSSFMRELLVSQYEKEKQSVSLPMNNFDEGRMI
jgi:hypothetical protein